MPGQGQLFVFTTAIFILFAWQVTSGSANCADYSVRLAGGETDSEGRIEVCYNGQWGTVCRDDFQVVDARVICRQLGLPDDVVEIYGPAEFGAGNGLNVVLGNVDCVGDETNITDCITTIGFNNMYCPEPHKRHTGLQCLNQSEADCEEMSVRLQSETDLGNTTGRVEVCYNGQWGTVCGQSFKLADGLVVCRQLGFPSVFEVGKVYNYDGIGVGSGSIWLDYVHCGGMESSIFNCSSSLESNICVHQLDAVVVCSPYTECTHGSVQLANGETAAEGRLEVCYKGIWQTVCVDLFHAIDGMVVCRQLGLPDSIVEIYSNITKFGEGLVGSIAFDYVTCNGEEDTLFNCSIAFGTFCYNGEVGMQCLKASEGECDTGAVELRGGKNITEGRVEVCFNGEWGTVCHVNFDLVDGYVVCKQLGFSGVNSIVYDTEFQQGDLKDVIWLNNVGCTGEEETLLDCDSSLYNGVVHSCDHTQDVGVVCLTNSECTEMSVRLVGGITAVEGRIEVCYIGRWWLVCSDFFNATDGSVICRQLGFSGTDKLYVASYFDQSEDYIALDYVTCTGKEDNIFDCDYQFYHYCVHHAVGIQCLNIPEATSSTAADSTSVPVTMIDSTSIPNSTSTSIVSDSTMAPPPTTGVYNTVVIGTVVGVLGIVGGVIVVFLIVAFIIRTKRKRKFSEYDLTMRMQTLQEMTRNSSILNNNDHDYVELAGRFKDKNKVSEELMTSLIQPPDLKLLEKIGQGEFGVVYRGILTQHNTEPALLAVAVKTLKGFYSQAEIDDLMQEAEKMKSFDHLHVLTLTGICVGLLESPCIVMPFMSNGSLLSYLRKEAPNLLVSDTAEENILLDTMKQLLSMCLQVAKGMAYMSQRKIIHRDLAARNCMISAEGVIKVADFGLAEEIVTTEYFKQDTTADETIKLPIKWMALESIHYGKFSEKTDVWSYGILCWEVFSVGKSPYPGMIPKEVVDMLDSGERISKPSNPACREEVFSLMMTCWKFSPDERPGFADIVERINEILVPLAEYMDFSFTN